MAPQFFPNSSSLTKLHASRFIFPAACTLLISASALMALSAFVSALRVLLGNVGVFLGAMALPFALPLVVLGVGLVDSFTLASCAFMLGVSLLQTLVFIVATRWVLSLV